ncbi:Protein kinase domain-containing protein [Thiothrix caldifontis]|uniref:non-specific serine/threonine protein kinase n=1 Tax=Thiothrix caldifontis TaxID=525918 RepID=A0A1H4G4Y8_9GAMM|nr:serine/threonine-protein kinase [Thiothrix caldifontis]SEB04693.1 Protein kinase domain-containing protein [Thiothrix caldifontis]
MPHQEHRQALPAGTQLREYDILRTLGSGGFGVAYLAYDRELAHHVVLKEYLPGAFATRLAGNTVVPTSPKDEANFQWGLERFLSEARALAAFRAHPHIVSVLHSFRANNTAYMVMEYAGEFSLQQFLDGQGVMTQEQLLDLVLPLLDALETIHAAGLIHRDIKPDNILINDNAEPVLIDFGAARQAVGERSMSLSIILTPGYAPFEQYHHATEQGPWTDIYALAAVMFRCVTGKNPPDAPARMETETPLELEPREGYSPHLLAAIAWGLQIRAAERPQTVAVWREALLRESVEKGSVTHQTGVNVRGGLLGGKRRMMTALLGSVLLLGLAFLGIAALSSEKTTEPPAVAQASGVSPTVPTPVAVTAAPESASLPASALPEAPETEASTPTVPEEEKTKPDVESPPATPPAPIKPTTDVKSKSKDTDKSKGKDKSKTGSGKTQPSGKSTPKPPQPPIYVMPSQPRNTSKPSGKSTDSRDCLVNPNCHP